MAVLDTEYVGLYTGGGRFALDYFGSARSRALYETVERDRLVAE